MKRGETAEGFGKKSRKSRKVAKQPRMSCPFNCLSKRQERMCCVVLLCSHLNRRESLQIGTTEQKINK